MLVKVDVGFHRCGIDPTAAGAAEHRRARRRAAGAAVPRAAEPRGPRLRRRFGRRDRGHCRRRGADAHASWRAKSNGSGVPVQEISVGATPTARFSLKQDGITELRPGNYIYFDRTQVALGAATWDDCALTVLARVVSRPAADRVILDCGSKTLSNDQARGFVSCPGFGVVFADLDTPRPGRIAARRTPVRGARDRARARQRDAALKPGDLVRVSARTTRASCRTWSTRCGWWTAMPCSMSCRWPRAAGSREPRTHDTAGRLR